MINEEIARKTLSFEIKAAKVTGKLLLALLKKLMREAKKLGDRNSPHQIGDTMARKLTF